MYIQKPRRHKIKLTAKIFGTLPNPAISTDIWVTFTSSSKAWALSTSTLTLGTMAASEPVFAALGTTEGRRIYYI